MKIYSREQKEEAKKKLPKPILDFLGSQSLTNLYVGIQKKLKLNLRQLMMFSEITNVTLMGLEDEHALEASMHQWLPELSNADTRELTADINDRIFKEAKRRLEQNVQESQKPKDDEAEDLDLSKPSLSDIELDKLAEQQEKEGWQPPIDPNEGPEGDVPEALDEEADSPQVGTPNQPMPSISEIKLGGPLITKTEEVNVKAQLSGIQQIKMPSTSQTNEIGPMPTDASSVASRIQKPPMENPPIAAPRTYKGEDPYREPIE